MNVSSSTQTQYTSQAQSKSSSVQETPKNNQQSRYEMLLDKGDNMSKAEWKELHHYNAMQPVKYLDKAGNAALYKALEGKTDDERFQIKGILEIEFMTSVKANHNKHTVDRQRFDSIDTSKNATIDRFETFIEDSKKNGSVDNIGLIDVMNNFLNIYKNSSAEDMITQEDSVVDDFLDDLYSSSSTATTTASAITKENIQNKVNEYAQTLMETRNDTPESKLEVSKLLNDYKKELLNEYRESLEGSKNGNMTLQQEAIVKVLLDENTKQASSLEKLLANKEVDKTQSVAVTVGTDKTAKYNNLPDKFIDAVYDNSNTFGMFLKENDKGLELLDKFVENMDEDEKSRFLFVFGHIGNEHLLKKMADNNLSSPQEAIPYANDEMKKFNSDLFFTESLAEMINDKSVDSEVKAQLKEFYKLYTVSIESAMNVDANTISTQNDNSYKDSGLPDWMDQKINTIYPLSEGNNLDTGRGWFKARLRLNAIAMSGGQSDMKINEENLDWKEVLEFTAESFKNNMQSSHTNEMVEKYENFLNKPGSQYYSYSDEIKQQMIEEYKSDNYALNTKGFSAAESLLQELKIRESSILQSNTARIDSVNIKDK